MTGQSRTTRRGVVTGALASSALAVSVSDAAAPDTPFFTIAPDAGWSEAVVVVADLQRALAFYAEVAGWRPISTGTVHASVLRLWNLPQAARGREALLANPGDRTGFVRLIQLENAGAQVQIRSSAMPWETGGVFSLMTRSRNLDRAFEATQRLGYSSFSDPVEFDFGGVVLRNIVLRGPDGVNVAIYQRQKPALSGWSTIRRLSAPFNAMQMVKDRDRTRDFYRAVFGYGVLSEADFLDPADGPNNFALPANLVRTTRRRFAIMAIAGAEIGRVEAMQFVGLEGRDLSDRAQVPNFGIAALRFPTGDLGALTDRARRGGFATSVASDAVVAPYGRIRLARVRSPDGVMIEAFSRSSVI